MAYDNYLKAGFNTPSGKVELYSETLASQGYDPMPTFKASPESPFSGPELLQEYPILLSTGARHLEFCHSQHHNLSGLRQRVPEPLAEINPETAAKYGIGNGAMMVIETKRGKIKIKTKVTRDIIPDMVSIPHRWNEANANILTDSKPADPVVGYPALKSVLCKISA